MSRCSSFRLSCHHIKDQLLEQFVAQRAEPAFEALVRRHGPMVLGVCRRVLQNEADAEDAFQATFLVLVRKAGSVQPRELVGHWLYGVAYRTAVRAKALEARRRMKERAVFPPSQKQDGIWQDVLPLLDQELSGLPEKYRVPVVLCDLEGKSRKEAAQAGGSDVNKAGSTVAQSRAAVVRSPGGGGDDREAKQLAEQEAQAAKELRRLDGTLHELSLQDELARAREEGRSCHGWPPQSPPGGQEIC